MDKAVRGSVAALWESFWGSTAEQRPAVLVAMSATMTAGGVTVRDVADWIRQDRVELPDMSDVSIKPEGQRRTEEQMDLVKALANYHYNKMSKTESAFIESVAQQLDDGRYLSSKQAAWLNGLGRKYGV